MAEPAGESRPRSTDRAFVVQFDPVRADHGRLRGRVESVASGEVTRFRSLKQLVAFMTGALRRSAGAE